MILCNKEITKALIRMRGCAGWSAPLLFKNPEDRFSHDEAHMILFRIVSPAQFVEISNHQMNIDLSDP